MVYLWLNRTPIRPGHDRRYAIDNTKITTLLGWEPTYTFEQGMKETIEWYLNNTEWIENIVSGDYANYYEGMYSSIDEVAAAKGY
jgi:dTDP-glucose 4,6-dehydratase